MDSSFSPNSFFELSGFEYKDLFENKENVWDVLKELETYISSQFRRGLKANYKGLKNVWIGEGTKVSDSANLKSNVLIGKKSFIGPNVYLRENCFIGDDVSIGHGVEIKNSIVLSNTMIAHLNYVGDSIVGSNVNIGGGAMTANFRLDKQKVAVKFDGEKLETGLDKFGAVIGDNSSIGVNAVLNPGTILGKNCIVFPLTSVTGVHPENSRIKRA